MILRGGIYWADLGAPDGSHPAKRRTVLVIQSDSFNDSRLATVLATVITSNTALAAMPGNVFLSFGGLWSSARLGRQRHGSRHTEQVGSRGEVWPDFGRNC